MIKSLQTNPSKAKKLEAETRKRIPNLRALAKQSSIQHLTSQSQSGLIEGIEEAMNPAAMSVLQES